VKYACMETLRFCEKETLPEASIVFVATAGQKVWGESRLVVERRT